MFWNSTIYPKQINHRVYQIHKEGGVVNRFLTARRHFWTPWSERTNCMGNGQSFFFLPPHTPYGRERLARFARVRLLRNALPISLLILRKKKQQKKKKRLFCSLPLHGMEKFSFLGLPTLITRCHFVNLTSFKNVSSLFSSSSEASTWLEILDTHAQLTQPAWAKGRVKYCHWTPHNIQNLVGKQN